MLERAQFDIKEMARWLEMRRNNNHSTVLLLGSRAGALFHSDHFFDCMRAFSPRDLSHLPRAAQFSENYLTLVNGQFSETDIHSIFRTSFQNLALTKADICLAELVKQDHFDEIISTNIDNLLVSSFLQIEMSEQRDFEVLYSHHGLLHEKNAMIRLTKIFGDFGNRNYNLKRYLGRSDKEQESIGSLQRLLAKDILIVGLDPRWDRSILDAIPAESGMGMVWFVNEEDDLIDQETIGHILRHRPSQYIVGREGRFEYFIRALHGCLYGGTPLTYQVGRDILNQLVDISDQLADLSRRIQILQDNQNIMARELRAIQNKNDTFLQS